MASYGLLSDVFPVSTGVTPLPTQAPAQAQQQRQPSYVPAPRVEPRVEPPQHTYAYAQPSGGVSRSTPLCELRQAGSWDNAHAHAYAYAETQQQRPAYAYVDADADARASRIYADDSAPRIVERFENHGGSVEEGRPAAVIFDLALVVVEGIILIFAMEQFVQIGIKLAGTMRR